MNLNREEIPLGKAGSLVTLSDFMEYRSIFQVMMIIVSIIRIYNFMGWRSP